MSTTRLLEASMAALLVTTALGSGSDDTDKVMTCQNDQTGAGQDSGCPSTAPLSVHNDDLQEPVLSQSGSKSAPCINYHEHPEEPDWGCPPHQPLCVGEDGNRPELGSAGVSCAPYPCRNTRQHAGQVDEGCTASHPTCVDALNNDPLPGKPGIQCIAYEQTPPTTTRLAQAAWGLLDSQPASFATRRISSAEATTTSSHCLITGLKVQDLKAGGSDLSLCRGCPFGLSTQCGIGASQLSW